LRILASTHTPFAVKGGGAATNLGFSSTNGVLISMMRFNQINVNSADGTVELGAGLTSDQVYQALEPRNITVMAAGEPGVGIAGMTLAGGERLPSLGVFIGSELRTTYRYWFEEWPSRPRHRQCG
jgi:FAD/FMN-containing dehydrogenase